MMKLLYILQPSVYKPGPRGNTWSTADSNINMTTGFFKNLLNLEKDIQIIFMTPQVHNYVEYYNDDKKAGIRTIFSKINDIYLDDRIIFQENYNSPVHPFYYRYHFNMSLWIDLLISHDFDCIINNVTELSRNIKTILVTEKLKAKLITQCFFLDCPMICEAKVDQSMSLDFRQLDGFECSDLITFTCESTANAWLDNTRKRYNHDNTFVGAFKRGFIGNILDKSTIWDFGYDESENDILVPKNKSETKKILFLNRFSDYTHYKDLMEACNRLYKIRTDFEVYFTNPSSREVIPNDRIFFNYQMVPLNRKKYWELLNNGDISVHLFVKERYGGCALRESISAGNLPIVANCHEQRTLVKDSRLLVECDTFKDEINIDSLVECINNALNIIDNQTLFKEIFTPIFEENYNRCEFHNTTKKALEQMKQLCKK